MKKLFIYFGLVVIAVACNNSSNDKPDTTDRAKTDTTIIGSDNPNPQPDTSKMDSLRK